MLLQGTGLLALLAATHPGESHPAAEASLRNVAAPQESAAEDPLKGSFPGSFRIPGTKLSMQFGGRIKLDAIHDYIARDSKTYARKVVDRITRRTLLLATFPESGALAPGLEGEGVREVLSIPFRIRYRIVTDAIEVVAVFHAARSEQS